MAQPFRIFLKTPSLGVKTCLFGWPNFTGFVLIEHILRKISTTYEKSTAPLLAIVIRSLVAEIYGRELYSLKEPMGQVI
jgi:hypothetical protein